MGVVVVVVVVVVVKEGKHGRLQRSAKVEYLFLRLFEAILHSNNNVSVCVCLES